jgi:hypothetical protein
MSYIIYLDALAYVKRGANGCVDVESVDRLAVTIASNEWMDTRPVHIYRVCMSGGT